MTTNAHWTYTVTGTGPFPFDMLRYDCCYPSTERDSAAIERSTRRRARGAWTVKVVGLRAPTKARWESFGWTILDTPTIGETA